MGWREFQAWLEIVKDRREAATRSRVSPTSWEGADSDPAWVQMRAERDALIQH